MLSRCRGLLIMGVQYLWPLAAVIHLPCTLCTSSISPHHQALHIMISARKQNSTSTCTISLPPMSCSSCTWPSISSNIQSFDEMGKIVITYSHTIFQARLETMWIEMWTELYNPYDGLVLLCILFILCTELPNHVFACPMPTPLLCVLYIITVLVSCCS